MTPIPDDELQLLARKHMDDTFHNRTALSTSRDSTIISKLQGYGEGSPIRVTWFNQMDSVANNQSTTNSVSYYTNNVNVSYLKINNFEVRLRAGFVFSYNDEANQSTLTGTCLVYPGFIPKQADVFVYEMEPGKLGLFKVTGPAIRLSIKSRTSHEVPFELVGILKGEDLTALLARVRSEAWFNKSRFLLETTALLTSDDVQDLEYIRNKYEELSAFYVDNFYRKYTYGSFVRPDDVYDPYIVDFIKETMVINTPDVFAEQLLDNAVGLKSSFWTKLRNPKKQDFRGIHMNQRLAIHEIGVASYRVNSLINRPYVELTKDPVVLNEVSKYFSDNINNPDMSGYTDLDTLISFWMTYGVVDVDILFNLCDGIYDVTPLEQFYNIPVYLYMMQLLANSIETGASIKLAVPGSLPYHNIPFTETSDELAGNILTIASPDSKVIGIVDNTGTPRMLTPSAVTYSSAGFVIDFTQLKTDLSISTFTGTWTVVISNPSLALV
jgi:hypothetical protein